MAQLIKQAVRFVAPWTAFAAAYVTIIAVVVWGV